MVPALTGKLGKMAEKYLVMEKSGNFKCTEKSRILNALEKSGNFTQNTGKMNDFYTKYWKSYEILGYFYLYFFQ